MSAAPLPPPSISLFSLRSLVKLRKIGFSKNYRDQLNVGENHSKTLAAPPLKFSSMARRYGLWFHLFEVLFDFGGYTTTDHYQKADILDLY